MYSHFGVSVNENDCTIWILYDMHDLLSWIDALRHSQQLWSCREVASVLWDFQPTLGWHKPRRPMCNVSDLNHIFCAGSVRPSEILCQWGSVNGSWSDAVLSNTLRATGKLRVYLV